MRWIAVFMTCISGTAIAADPMFCRASGSNLECTHYTIESCQMAVRSFGGACVTNPGASSPSIPRPTINDILNGRNGAQMGSDAFNEGIESTRRSQILIDLPRLIKKSYTVKPEDRTKLLGDIAKLDPAAAESVQRRWWEEEDRAKQSQPAALTFTCNDDNGEPYITTDPKPGCVVR